MRIAQSDQQLHSPPHLWPLLLGDSWVPNLGFGVRIDVVQPVNATASRRGSKLTQEAHFGRRRHSPSQNRRNRAAGSLQRCRVRECLRRVPVNYRCCSSLHLLMRKSRLTVRLVNVGFNWSEGDKVRIRSLTRMPTMACQQMNDAEQKDGWRQDDYRLDVVRRRLERVEQIGEKIVVIHGRTLNHDLSAVGTPDCT